MPFVLFHLLFSMLKQHSEICPKIVLHALNMDSPGFFCSSCVTFTLIFNQSEIKGTIFHNTLKKGQRDTMDTFHCHKHTFMYPYYICTDDTSLVRTGFWSQPRVTELERFTVCTRRNLNPCTSCRPANQ